MMNIDEVWNTLPKPVQDWILRKAGDLAGRVLTQAGHAVRKAITGDSLSQVLQAAIARLVSKFPQREFVDYRSVLETVFDRPEVADEMGKMFKTTSGKPDRARLSAVLIDAGLDVNTLPDFNLDDAVEDFIRTCRDMALAFPDLQGVMKTRALLLLSGEGDEPNLGALRRTYLQDLIARYQWLDFIGIPQARNIVRLRLDDIFVPLSATKEMPKGDVLEAVASRRAKGPASTERIDLAEREGIERRASLKEALTEPRLVILGDPGCGKTTLLKHIALTLAQGRGKDLGFSERDGSPVPILFPVAAYATELRQHERSLSDYLADYFAAREIPDLAPFFRDALERGRAIVLLDGLDEVLDLSERMQVVRRVQDFVRRYSSTATTREKAAQGESGNRFVVTSRIAGYEAARLGEFAHVTVLPFGDQDIERFVARWCLAYERLSDASAGAQARAAGRSRDLTSAIMASESVRHLAANPLLLTIIALIHYQNVRLPERRVDLYCLAVETLAESWNRARSLAGQAIDLYLGERRLDARFVVRILGPVALWLHGNRPGGLMEQRDLEAKLADILGRREGVTETRSQELAHAFLDLVRRGSGLLQERGLGLYGFLHLTFEEYLAARAIADLDPDAMGTLLKHWADPAWREVILLALGASSPEKATRLIDGLLDASAEGEAFGSNVVLAGRALADVGRDGVIGGVWQRTVGLLTGLLEEQASGRHVPVVTRVDAGDVLGLLGDPRLTDEAWVEVPADGFLMGSTPQDLEELRKRYSKEIADWAKNELPQRRVHVKTFRIRKYPVTNQEFKRFMDAGGYETRGYWSDESWRWLHRGPEDEKGLPGYRQREGRRQPAFWDDPWFGIRRPNCQVVGVTWYEAQAYCNWLTERLREEGRIGRDDAVGLPTEAEWEKAARGVDGRWWPWGNEWDPGRANTEEGKVGGTTPVGIYSGGVSPYGAFDMAGNVWEWTSSLYKPYPYKPDDGREDPNAEGTRVVRGGSWGNPQGYARCASRLDDHPDVRDDHLGFRCCSRSLKQSTSES